MDYSRQQEIFMPDTFKQPVHVVGCGATGSWVAMMLAKLGIKDIHLHDFDIVEEHNLPNQLFSLKDISYLKTTGCKQNIINSTGINPEVHEERVTGDTPLAGIVFLLTDTMSSRAEIFKKALKYNVGVPLMIETRMGLEGGRIYAINPCDPVQIKKYEQTLYTDEEAVVSACGVSQSLAPTAASIAGYAVWQLIKWHNKVDMDNEIIFDMKYNQLLTQRY